MSSIKNECSYLLTLSSSCRKVWFKTIIIFFDGLPASPRNFVILPRSDRSLWNFANVDVWMVGRRALRLQDSVFLRQLLSSAWPITSEHAVKRSRWHDSFGGHISIDFRLLRSLFSVINQIYWQYSRTGLIAYICFITYTIDNNMQTAFKRKI